MKKQFIIVGIILAFMFGVHPAYAVVKHFSLTVTITDYSMELLTSDGNKPYTNWTISIPSGSEIMMTAQDAVMVSLTGPVPSLDFFSSVYNNNNWTPITLFHCDPAFCPSCLGDCLTMTPPQHNEFSLEVFAMDTLPIGQLAPSWFMSITENTKYSIMNTSSTPIYDNNFFLIYRFHSGPSYDNKNGYLEVKIEAMPSF